MPFEGSKNVYKKFLTLLEVELKPTRIVVYRMAILLLTSVEIQWPSTEHEIVGFRMVIWDTMALITNSREDIYITRKSLEDRREHIFAKQQISAELCDDVCSSMTSLLGTASVTLDVTSQTRVSTMV